MRYNLGAYCVIYQMDGATKVTPNGYGDFAVNTFQNPESQLFYLNGTISKRMSSEPQTCTVSFSNPASLNQLHIIEDWLANYQQRSVDFLENDFQLEILAGYSENGTAVWHTVFLGDITSIDIPQAATVSDMAFVFTALGGNREMNRPKVRNKFLAETSDLEIVEFIYNIWFEEWGTLRGVIADPDGKLATTLRKRPFTIDKDEVQALNDIAELHDYVWGIDRNHFFCVPKNYVGDVLTDDKTVYTVDTRTGKVGISGLERGRVAFSHLIDADLQLGRAYAASDAPSLSVPPMELRCDSLEISIDNKAPQPCAVSGYILDGDVAKLPDRKSRVDNGMMR